MRPTTTRFLHLTLLGALLHAAHDVSAQSPRTDSFGDPLPAGAVARLGTLRWRPDARPSCAAFSPDGKVLASGASESARVSIWDIASGKELTLSSGRGRRPDWWLVNVQSLVFSPDGQSIASAGSDRYVRIWDVKTGKERHLFSGHVNSGQYAFCPDRRHLAIAVRESGYFDRGDLSPTECVARLHSKIRIHDLVTGKHVRSIPCPGCVIAALAYSADGQSIITAHAEEAHIPWKENEKRVMPRLPSLRVWDVSSLQQRTAIGERVNNNAMVLTPDGKTAITGDHDKTIRFYDVTTGKEFRTLSAAGKPAPSNREKGTVVCLALSLDGKTLISTCADETVLVWDVDAGKVRRQLPDRYHAYSLAVSRDGKLLAITGDKAVNLVNLETGEPMKHVPVHRQPVLSLAVSADGKTLASADCDEVHLWELPHGKRLRGVVGAGCVALSPDGKWLAAGTRGETTSLVMQDVATGRAGPRIPNETACVAISPDSRHVAVESGFWEIATGKPAPFFRDLPAEQRDALHSRSRLSAVAWSADGKMIAWAGYHGSGIWHLPPAHAFCNLGLVHATSLAFSLDGRFLASAGGTYHGQSASPHSLRLWDTRTGTEPWVFDKDPGNVVGVAFSPDGRVLASGSSDGSLILWEVATCTIRQRLPGHRRKINCLAFVPGSRLLASGSDDSNILLWDTSPRLALDGDADRAALESWWNDLDSTDGEKAFRIVQHLAAAKAYPAFVRAHLRPIAPVDPRQLAQLVDNLGSTKFAVRQQAMTELTAFIDRAEPQLRKYLNTPLPLETKQRLQIILRQQEALELSGSTAWDLRSGRALEALELAGCSASRSLLQELSQGVSTHSRTRDARAALARLK